MKKIILILTMLLLPQFFSHASAQEPVKTINLHSGAAYILDFDKRPIELQVTNPRILKAEVTTEIFSEESQIVIRTYEEGISYITFKNGNTPKTIKVLIDNKAPLDDSVIELDTVKELPNK